jgi:hypothetical protein
VHLQRFVVVIAAACLLCCGSSPAWSAENDTSQNILPRLEALERENAALRQSVEELKSGTVPPAVGAAPLAGDGKQVQESPTPAARESGFFGAGALTNPNISLVLDTFAHTSDLKDDELESRGIPGFTTNGLEQRNGFNLRAAELFIFAPVDPYFNLYVNLPVTEDGIELEEAYAVTTALPEGFQVKGGKFKSNFSRLNAQHPHAWDFFDIALPYRAFLGDEGLGGEKGVQLTWLPAWPVYTQFGAEALQGENDLLFGADAANGPHAFSLFVKASVDTTDNSTLYFGPSVLFGKTKTENIVHGAEFDGESALYGLEAVWKWKPQPRRGLTLQGEYLYLDQDGDLTDVVTTEVDSLRRRQDGFYVQGIYQLNRWRVGARYDALELLADRFEQAGIEPDLGDTPWRATAAVEFNPSEFTRIRVQYNHDESGRDGRSNDEAILQFLFGIGAHAAHTF